MCPSFVSFSFLCRRFVLLLGLFSPSLLMAETVLINIDVSAIPEEYRGRNCYLEILNTEGVKRWQDANRVAVQKVAFQAAAESDQVVKFQDLLPGNFAVRGYIDLNENGELDKNAKSRPAEPVGYSIKPGRAKPSFKLSRATFEVVAGVETQVTFALLASGAGGNEDITDKKEGSREDPKNNKAE